MSKIRTEVEKLFLKEMVLEDQQYTAIGECDAIDYISDEPISIFDSDDEETTSINFDDDEFEFDNIW